MDLGNPLEAYLLVEEMVGLSHRDRFPMVSVLVCMVTYWIGPKWVMTQGYQVVMAILSCFIVLSLNLEKILSIAKVSGSFNIRVRS